MAIQLSDIETLVRSLVQDFSHSGTDIFTYNASAVFTLTETNVVSVSSVSRNDVSSGVTYSYSSTTNKVTVTSALNAGDTLEVQYTYYPSWSTTEVEEYIKAALVHISTHNYRDFIVDSSTELISPEPDTREQNLIALITAILMKPDNRSYRLPDVSIVVAKTLSTPELITRAIMIFKKNLHGIFTIA